MPVVEFLLAHNADPSIQDEHGNDSFDYARD